MQNSFNPDLTNHRLGIVLAIMFSKLLPNIAFPKSWDFDPQTDVTAKVRELTWIAPNHKGVSQTEPFITMMSTTIIAILDKESPLRIHMALNNNALGDPWMEKHGESRIYIT